MSAGDGTGPSSRVLFVINSLARGGAETQLMGVVRAAVEAGHDVGIATLLTDNDFTAELADLGVPVWAPPPGSRSWSPAHLVRLVLRMRRWRPEVTVAFLLQATLFTRLANLVVRPRRRISSMRNERLETPLRTRLYRLTCRADDEIVVNSRAAHDTLRSSGTVPATSRLHVVYNGVDRAAVRARVGRSRAETRRALGLGEDDVVLLGVGRLSAQKDWGTLLRALAERPDPRVRCLVAGTGADLEELTAQARSLGVADRVQWLGLRHDVPDLMHAADALVLSSRYEGTPNVVLEALCLDLPVIATRVGACAELLTREHDAVVPVGDPVALAAAVHRLATGPAVAARRAPLAGPAPADDPFAWPRIGAQWLALIEEPA